jgi:hypothetical protein
MKITVKSTFFFLAILSVFTSCKSYKVMHYSRDEINNISGDVVKYRVYIHDKTSLYKVDKPNLSTSGVSGDLTPVLNPDTVAEIKNPHTKQQYKRRIHDLNIYTKTEVKTSNITGALVLKKTDITDVSHIITKVDIAEDIETGAILGLGVVVWAAIIISFQGML